MGKRGAGPRGAVVCGLALLAGVAGALPPALTPAHGAGQVHGQAQSGCVVVLGIAALRALIGAAVVGECLEDERHNPENGDALQATTGGLLVWRKADNWTAFTDGYRTWLNGPFGLQQRLNAERFFWEANPDRLPVIPPPQAGDRCHTAGLALRLSGVDAGAGNVVATFHFTNEADVPCVLFGFVGAQLLDAGNTALPTRVVRGGGFLANEPGPLPVTVPPGGMAVFRMHWGQVPVGDETTCPEATHLAVIPPDEVAPLRVPVIIRACAGGLLHISVVQAVQAARTG